MLVHKERLTVFKKAENWFLFFGLIFGLVFILLTPPFQVPDEQDHFFTAYAISQRQSRSTNSQIPVVFTDMWESVKDMRFHYYIKTSWSELKSFISTQSYEPRTPVSLYGTRFYSSLIYFPQAAGIAITKALDFPPLIVFWSGRFFALLFWLLVIYFSLAIIPTFKWVLLLIALNPTSLSVAASYSADSLTNAFSFLMFAVLLKAVSPDWERINLRRTILLGLTFLPFLILKFPFITQFAMLFLIPLRKFIRKRYLWCLLFAALACVILWFLRIILFSNAPLIGIHENTPGNLPFQLKFIVAHPIVYLGILKNTLAINFGWYLATFAGVLGWIDTIIPQPAILLFYSLLIILPFFDHRPDLFISNRSKIILLAASIAVILGIFTTMYLSWSTVGISTIDGVQGRYFLPIIPVLCLLAYNKRVKVPEKWVTIIVPASIFLILCASSFALFFRYFG